MKNMGHKIQTRVISGLLVFVMVFASIVSAGLVLDVDFGKMFSALGFGSGDSGTNLNATLNTTNPGSFITAEGNYGYEITASASKLTVDGTRDAAYTNGGMKITSNYLMPSSASMFDVYFAADDTNLYVLYEFSKAEQIFYDASYGAKYHLDLAEFHLDLAAAQTTGKVFQVNGGIAGDETSATKPNIVSNTLGVTDYTVKHTGKGGYGYNIEFAIPLSSVTGSYNGAKAVTFTALSTITTAWANKSAAPTRVYTFAQNAWCDAHSGSTDSSTPKSHPSTLVIKESNSKFATPAGQLGNYIVKTDGLVLNGLREEAYDLAGVTVPAVHNLSRGGFDFSYAADDDYVYFLYEVKKTNTPTLYYDASYSAKYHLDNVDFVMNLDNESTSYTEWHINAYAEGWGIDPETGGKGAAISYDYDKVISSGVSNFYVKHIEKTDSYVRYNVEFAIPINKITGRLNGFPAMTYLAMASMTAPNGSAYGATYPRIANSNNPADNNEAKKYRNMIVVVDSEDDIKPVTRENDKTFVPEAEVNYTTAYGSYGYYLNETDKTTIVDGYRDVSYAEGLKFSNTYNRVMTFGDYTYSATPDPDNTYSLYVNATAEKIYFLYEFTDENIVINGSSEWYNDGVQFTFGKDALANSYSGNGSIFYATGPRVGTVKFGTVAAPYALIKTDVGYNVEFVVNRSEILNGDTFSFVGRSTLADSATQRTYGFTDNVLGSADDNTVTKYCNQIHICDVNTNIAEDSLFDAVISDAGTSGTDNRWKYYLVESNTALVNDGVKDAAYASGLVFHQAYNRVQGGLTTPKVLNNNYFTVYVAADANNLYYLYEVVDDDIVSNAPASSTHWNDSIHFRMDKEATKNAGTGGNSLIQAANEVKGATFTQQSMTYTYSVVHTDNGYNVEISVPRSGLSNGGTAFSWVAAVSIAWRDPSGAFGANTYGFTANAGGDATDASLQNYANYIEIVDEKPVIKANIGDLYNDITAPVAGTLTGYTATTAITSLKNSSSVAIVYPKNTTQAVLDLVKLPTGTIRNSSDATKSAGGIFADYYNSLAPLSSFLPKAVVLEEGDSKISNYTYKILVGHVNSYAETQKMVDAIGYDKYGVGVFGNTISIIGATEQMLEKAVETFKKEVNGSLAAKVLYYGTSPAVAGGMLEYISGAKIVTDNGYGSYQIVKSGVDYAAFSEYCSQLLKDGYKIQSYNTMGGGYITKVFYNATDIVTVSYGLRYSILLYSDQSGKNFYGNNDANLDKTEMAMAVSVAARSVSDLPENRTDYEKVTDTVYVHATQDWDLVEIVRLENGEFIIFDAAHTADALAIIDQLYALSNGQKPVVAGWFISHFHQDHMGGLVEIGMKYSDMVTVKNVISQIGSEHLQGTCYNYRGNQPSTSDKANIQNFLPAMKNLGAKITTVATGQVYNFANASVEVLYTFADSMPFRLAADDTNRTGAIYSLTLHVDNTNQRYNINGDTTTEEFNMATKRYGSYLKSDVLQVAHHGNGEANDRCTLYYKTINPSYVIVSRSYDVGTNLSGSDTAIIDFVKAKYDLTTVNVDDVIIYAAVKEGNEYKAKVRYLDVPYSTGKFFEFPGIGATFTAEFNNTATGVEDSDNGVAANTETRTTMPVGMLENGSYLYVANTFYGDITTDGIKDNAYTYGIHLKDNKTDNKAKTDVSFDVYLVAGQDGKIHVLYEVVDNYYFTTTTTGWNRYRQDGADFWYGFGTPGTVSGDFRIKAVEGAEAQAAVYGDSKLASLLKNDYAVVVTAADGVSKPVVGQPAKYTVEFTIDNNGKLFENGDMMTFLPVVNTISEWASGDEGGYKPAENKGHSNANITVDTAVTSASGSYCNPNVAPAQGKHNVLVFSTAPATAQDQRPAVDSDNNICLPGEEITFEKEIIGSIDTGANNKAHAQAVYGIGTAYADIVTDGEMENIYYYGYKLSDTYVDNAEKNNPRTHGFDAYIVYAQDGKVHVFVEVTDSTMKTVNGQKIGYGFESGNEARYWRRDSVHFYYNFATDGSTANRSSKTLWIGAVAGGDQSAIPDHSGLPETGTYFVKMTDKGYNVEFVLDRNGSDFYVGDYFEFGLYLNCASSENDPSDTTNKTTNEKFSLTHASYYNDNFTKGYTSPNEYAFDGIKIVTSDSVTAGLKTHKYETVVTEATCTTAGYTTHTCAECGDSYTDNHVDAKGHTYNGDATCDVCNKVIKINSATLTLRENISVSFKVNTSQLDHGQTITKVVFEFNGKTYVVTDIPAPVGGQYTFTFSNLGPHQMGDVINATVYFNYKGEEIATKTQPYSILQYCTSQLSKAANPASMKKVLVDMLNYGAAAQIKQNYKTDSLVNSSLTAAQLALGTSTSTLPALKSCQDLGDNNSAAATWRSASIVLGDTIRVKVSARLPSAPENYKIVMRAAGKTWTSTAFTAHATEAGRYEIEFAVLNPAQMRAPIEFVIYDQNGVAVSSILTYSIETYAYNQTQKASVSQKDKDLLYAMIRYGDSVAAYVSGN